MRKTLTGLAGLGINADKSTLVISHNDCSVFSHHSDVKVSFYNLSFKP